MNTFNRILCWLSGSHIYINSDSLKQCQFCLKNPFDEPNCTGWPKYD